MGRLATKAATLLIGKHKPTFQSHIDDGDSVHITNARAVKITGRKLEQKELIHHSWHPGGLKRIPLKRSMEANPTVALRRAISKMLPRNSHRKNRLTRLTIEA